MTRQELQDLPDGTRVVVTFGTGDEGNYDKYNNPDDGEPWFHFVHSGTPAFPLKALGPAVRVRKW